MVRVPFWIDRLVVVCRKSIVTGNSSGWYVLVLLRSGPLLSIRLSGLSFGVRGKYDRNTIRLLALTVTRRRSSAYEFCKTP